MVAGLFYGFKVALVLLLPTLKAIVFDLFGAWLKKASCEVKEGAPRSGRQAEHRSLS